MSWQCTSWAERQLTGSAARKALLLVMATYADAQGVTWVSQETLAAGAEMSTDTVQRQSRKLVELGLIEIKRLPKRRGQWQGFCYRLILSKETRPPTKPQSAARSPAQLFIDGRSEDNPSEKEEFSGENNCSDREQLSRNTQDHVQAETPSAPAAVLGQPPDVTSANSATSISPGCRPGLDGGHQLDTLPPQLDTPPPQFEQVRSGQAAELAVRPGRKACGATGPQSLRHKPSPEPSKEPSPEPSRANRRDPVADRVRAFQGKQEGSEVLQNRIAQRLGPNGWLILGEMTDAQREKLTTLQRRGQLDDETLANEAARVALIRLADAGGGSKV